MGKLSKAQEELLEAMKGGVICHYMPYNGSFCSSAYYFRNDTIKRCTATARVLLKKGLIEEFGKNWREHKLRIKKGVE